jgi:hypothetical protein
MSEHLFGTVAYDPGATQGAAADAADAGVDDTPLSQAKNGIRLRDAGDTGAAETVLHRLIARHPGEVYGWQELGVLRRSLGDDGEALALFEAAYRRTPDDFTTCKHLGFQLARLGRGEEALAVLDSCPVADEGMAQAVAVFRQFFDYVSHYPEATAFAVLDQLEASPGILQEPEVAARLIAAVEAGAPFSLIRLGDGEGAWLSLDAADEARFALLYEANRREMLKIWFGTDTLYAAPGFMAQALGFGGLLPRADMVGLPYRARAAHEYAVASVRGIPSITNIFRAAAALPEKSASKAMVFCENDIHLELQLSGTLRYLLSGPHKVGLITCHADLGYRLAAAYGTRVARLMIVPEEKGFAQVSGASGLAFPHYPLAFYRTKARLERETGEARLWLVAAGFLGKFYCGTIRAQGGVALDIGSVADGWLRRITRPTFHDIERFALEPQL